MKSLQQSIEISMSLLPKAKNCRQSKNKFFHFAFGFKKNKLLAIGQNNPEKTHTKAFLLDQKFNQGLPHRRYPYLHAETDLISKMWGKYYIDESITIIVIRLNKHGKFRCSKPCTRCYNIINALGVKNLIWSENGGFNK